MKKILVVEDSFNLRGNLKDKGAVFGGVLETDVNLYFGLPVLVVFPDGRQINTEIIGWEQFSKRFFPAKTYAAFLLKDLDRNDVPINSEIYFDQ